MKLYLLIGGIWGATISFLLILGMSYLYEHFGLSVREFVDDGAIALSILSLFTIGRMLAVHYRIDQEDK